MSTQATFNGVTFAGIVTAAPEGVFPSDSDRSGISGVHGEDEIRMGRRGVPIDVTVWLFGFVDDAALWAYVMGTILPLVNTNGVLNFTGGLTRVYSFVTLDSMEPVDRPTTQAHDASIGRCQSWRLRFHCLQPV